MSLHAEVGRLMDENSDLRRALARLFRERAQLGEPTPQTWADVAAMLDKAGIDVYGDYD